MNKTAIIEALHELGFKVEEIENHGFIFEYENLRLLYNPEDDDDDFFRLNAPCVYKVEDEENRPVVLEIVNEVNNRIKYSKTTLSDDYVWVSYESRLFDGIDVEELVRHAIVLVNATVGIFYRKVNGGDDPASQINEEESNTENE